MRERVQKENRTRTPQEMPHAPVSHQGLAPFTDRFFVMQSSRKTKERYPLMVGTVVAWSMADVTASSWATAPE